MHSLQILPNNQNDGPHNIERYFLEIRERNRWILEMGGERVLLLKRKYFGTRCPNFDQIRKHDLQSDDICYGTGWVGGYFKPIEIMVSLMNPAQENAVIEEFGRRRSFKPSSWCLWEPLLTNGDLLIRKNNQRFVITNVTQCRFRSYVTHQRFEMAEVERNSPIYKVPV